jgi:hypothetical protein
MPTKVQPIIKPKATKALGHSLPPTLISRADEVVE